MPGPRITEYAETAAFSRKASKPAGRKILPVGKILPWGISSQRSAVSFQAPSPTQPKNRVADKEKGVQRFDTQMRLGCLDLRGLSGMRLGVPAERRPGVGSGGARHLKPET